MYFFFFFDGLGQIPVIQNAFKKVCLDKLISDGYFDMSIYLNKRLKKYEIYAQLDREGSKYAVLYKHAFPKAENALAVWQKLFVMDSYNDYELTSTEAMAIVYWVYRVLDNAPIREEFTKTLFSRIKELHGIDNNIRYSNNVFFNAEKIDLHFCRSMTDFSRLLSKLSTDQELFFRGHSNANYSLKPSIMRDKLWIQNESKMYHDLLINCPEDFIHCSTHLDKLVEMQHYGLPTRLLDITRNPLVALYFACEGKSENYGEVILITSNGAEVRYPQSDTISVISSLPVFSHEKQKEFLNWALDSTIDNTEFNKKAERLIHEIRLEKPAFLPEINKSDLLGNYIVHATKNNKRIAKQDGAFILCGLASEQNSLEDFRYQKNGKRIVVLIDKKSDILRNLDVFSINHATLFPEIECVSDYVKKKYSGPS